MAFLIVSIKFEVKSQYRKFRAIDIKRALEKLCHFNLHFGIRWFCVRHLEVIVFVDDHEPTKELIVSFCAV